VPDGLLKRLKERFGSDLVQEFLHYRGLIKKSDLPSPSSRFSCSPEETVIDKPTEEQIFEEVAKLENLPRIPSCYNLQTPSQPSGRFHSSFTQAKATRSRHFAQEAQSKALNDLKRVTLLRRGQASKVVNILDIKEIKPFDKRLLITSTEAKRQHHSSPSDSKGKLDVHLFSTNREQL